MGKKLPVKPRFFLNIVRVSERAIKISNTVPPITPPSMALNILPIEKLAITKEMI